MQSRGLQTFAFQGTGQAGTTQLAVHKNECLLEAPAGQHMLDRTALVFILHGIKTLLDGGRGFIGPRHLDGDWVLQIAVCQSLDLRGESSRKQQSGALLGQKAQNALQIRQEPNVQHAVGFVEYHILDLVQYGVLGFNMVQQTTGRGHQNFNAFFELQRLRFHVHAAKHHHAAHLGVLGVELDLLGHLVGQFTRGQQHQCAHRVARGRSGAVLVFEQALQQRQRKRRRFAGAGLGCAHHVLTGQHHRNGLRLNRRHGRVAHFGYRASQGLSQREIGKRVCH